MSAKIHHCAICAHDIKTSACPHPWEKAFEKWPKIMLERLRLMLQADPSDGS